MTISEKIAHSSPDEVKIYKEGIFWLAYEQSAYWFSMRKGYKPTKKFVKCLQQFVVSIGFPDSVLAEIVNSIDRERELDCGTLKIFVLKDYYFDVKKYEEWKENLPLKQPVGESLERLLTFGESAD